MILSLLISSCKSDSHDSDWVDGNPLTISQYLEKNQEEYSKFIRLLDEGKLLGTLYAYNPYGEDYTLFLPTDEAIDQFIQQNQEYGSFEELVKDTGFIKMLTRYHTINRKLHTDEFPDGALTDMTLTGDRLVIGFSTDGNNQFIKVNNKAQITESNLKMTNGYIHVISGVLQPAEITGYDWLQQQKDYTILAQAVRLSGVKSRLWWKKYTILAERDSVYRKNGINTVEDLVALIATPGMALTNKLNMFNLFVSYHFVGGEYYLNDFAWGSKKYTTLATGYPLVTEVGTKIKINPGVDTYGYTVSSTGVSTALEYILPIWAGSNILTSTGPVHSINEVLFFDPLP
jgi:uncharacterized surface protein with fasciclin (FAS1) repeats